MNSKVIALLLIIAVLTICVIGLNTFLQMATKPREIEDTYAERDARIGTTGADTVAVRKARPMVFRNARERALYEYSSRLSALVDATEAMRKNEAMLARAAEGLAAKYYNEALNYAQEQKYQEAIGMFIKAIKAEPDNIPIKLLSYKHMANLYMILKDERKYLIAMYKYYETLRAIEKDPRRGEEIDDYMNDIKAKLASAPD